MRSRALDANNDIFLQRRQIHTVTGGAQVVQNVRSRLLFYLGECVWDTTAGVPYFQQIFTKPMNLPQTEALLKREIIQTVGVSKLLDFRMYYDNTTRQLTVKYEAETTYDGIVGDTINTIAGVRP